MQAVRGGVEEEFDAGPLGLGAASGGEEGGVEAGGHGAQIGKAGAGEGDADEAVGDVGGEGGVGGRNVGFGDEEAAVRGEPKCDWIVAGCGVGGEIAAGDEEEACWLVCRDGDAGGRDGFGEELACEVNHGGARRMGR